MRGLESSFRALQSETLHSFLAHFVWKLDAKTRIFCFSESHKNLVLRAITPDYLNLYNSVIFFEDKFF